MLTTMYGLSPEGPSGPLLKHLVQAVAALANLLPDLIQQPGVLVVDDAADVAPIAHVAVFAKSIVLPTITSSTVVIRIQAILPPRRKNPIRPIATAVESLRVGVGS